MDRVAVLSTCSMSQCAMDVRGNVARIAESVRLARLAGARYRCGPEMDVTGYGCGDHFLEADTLRHAWEGVAWLLEHEACSSGILVDVGLPVQHNNVVYNCKLAFLNRRVLLIRPKMMLADDSHIGYQETRWFTPWQKVRQVEDHQLPPCITKITGQRSVPFGDALLATRDTTIGLEICEELWTPDSPHVGMSLAGAEIITNGSGGMWEVSRPDNSLQLVKWATGRSGGCYLFANQKGCDGSLGYYAGDASIVVNGKLVEMSALHTLTEMEVITARVDLDAVHTYRNLIRSRCMSAASATTLDYPRVQVDFTLCHSDEDEDEDESKEKLADEGGEEHTTKNTRRRSVSDKNNLHPLSLRLQQEPQWSILAEHVLDGAACWLWDFLRKSGHNGFILQLCGGVSDAATAAVVFVMCCKALETAQRDAQVKDFLRELTGAEDVAMDARKLCGRLLLTFAPPSGSHLDALAADLAEQIGSEHINPKKHDGTLMETVRSVEEEIQGQERGQGGNMKVHALQHLHAFRTYLFALRVVRGEFGWGKGRQLLVLAATPGGEAPKAFMRERSSLYSPGDCGHNYGDVSLVGHIPKGILREVLQLAKERYNLAVLGNILAHEAQRRKREGEEQHEEAEGEEEELNEMWNLHVMEHLGPRSMFLALVNRWRTKHSPDEVSKLVKAFFTKQGVSMATPPGAPSCYMEGSGPQQRCRPLLTPTALTWQFDAIEKEVKKLERQERHLQH